MSRVRYAPNLAAAVKLAREPEMAEAMRVRAVNAADAARALAPRDSGDYQDGIDSAVELRKTGWIGRVIARDYKSVWIEFGTGQPGPTRAFAPLRRGAEASGLRLRSVRGRR